MDLVLLPKKEVKNSGSYINTFLEQQSYILGETIKKRYGLDTHEEDFTFELISTQSKRTIETAKHFARGLLSNPEITLEEVILDPQIERLTTPMMSRTLDSHTVKLYLHPKGADHILKRHRQESAAPFKKEFHSMLDSKLEAKFSKSDI